MNLLKKFLGNYYRDSVSVEEKLRSDIQNDESKLEEAQFRLKYNLEVKAILMDALSNASSYRNINYFKIKLDSINRSIRMSKMHIAMYQHNIEDFKSILEEV